MKLVEKVEGGEHGQIGVALVRGGPTEDGQEPVARVTRQVAAAPFDDLTAEVLVAEHHVPVVLWVHLPREFRRAHHVRERDGEPAPLPLVRDGTEGWHASPAIRARVGGGCERRTAAAASWPPGRVIPVRLHRVPVQPWFTRATLITERLRRRSLARSVRLRYRRCGGAGVPVEKGGHRDSSQGVKR